jgi:hypothetical protein
MHKTHNLSEQERDLWLYKVQHQWMMQFRGLFKIDYGYFKRSQGINKRNRAPLGR